MTRFLAFLALCWCAFRADGGALLIITEATARGHAGVLFDKWVAQIQREGNFSPIIVREHQRWDGNWAVQDWTGLGLMSNDIVRINPSAVQLFGHLPWLVTGKHGVDGHTNRCITTHQWLSCIPGLTLTDSTTFTEMGYGAGLISPLIATNVAGDGRPDQTYGTFVRPVCFLDAAGLTEFTGPGSTFESGYLSGQQHQPAIDEGLWLRIYLTNNLAYRQQGWTVTDTGYVRTDAWLGYDTVVAVNNSVSWTAGTASLAGRTDRWIMHGNELRLWSPNFVTDEGAFTRVLVAEIYKSYCMEESVGQATYRRHLFPGWAPRPLSLVGAWGIGSAGYANPFWIAKSNNVTVADSIESSAVRYGGFVTWEIPICGDLTLPIDAITQAPPATATVGTLIVE